MISVRARDTQESLGTLSDDELRFIIDQLAEPAGELHQYWLDAETLELLEAAGSPPSLLAYLRRLIGSREGIRLSWESPAGDGLPPEICAGDDDRLSIEDWENEEPPPPETRLVSILRWSMVALFLAWMAYDVFMSGTSRPK